MSGSGSIWIQWNHLEARFGAPDEVALILKEPMEEAGRVFLKTIPVEPEVVIVGSWAEK
jgi:hypothetical protein